MEECNTAPRCVEKAGLSILGMILEILGLLSAIFYSLCKFNAVTTIISQIIPDFSIYSFYSAFGWILFAVTFGLLIAGYSISASLKKRNMGYPMINKITGIVYFIGLVVIILGVIFNFVNILA